jgi:hypothetical protein
MAKINRDDNLLRTLTDILRRIGILERRSEASQVFGASLTHSVTQATQTATTTVLSYNTVEFDTGGLYDPANATRLTAPTDGIYLVTFNMRWNTVSGGQRYTDIYLNNTRIICQSAQMSQTGETAVPSSISTIIKLSAGDYVETRLYQESGVQVSTSSTFAPRFGMARLNS